MPMKFAVGFQLYDVGEEPFSHIVETYKDHISEVFFAWQDIPTGRSAVATRHGYTDYSAQQRLEAELKAINAMGSTPYLKSSQIPSAPPSTICTLSAATRRSSPPPPWPLLTP